MSRAPSRPPARAASSNGAPPCADRLRDEPALAPAVRGIIEKYRLPIAHFEEIIAGCEMDVARTDYATWEELRLYCYRVASVVGLISIEIFGYRDPACREYAVQLGLALQVTNIIRDVGADLANDGRVYLPRGRAGALRLHRANCCRRGRTTEPLRRLLEHEAERADELYAAAIAALPPTERRSMIAAEIMRTIYSRLLRKMRRDGFRVLEKRYRLSALEKLLCIAQVLRGPPSREAESSRGVTSLYSIPETRAARRGPPA